MLRAIILTKGFSENGDERYIHQVQSWGGYTYCPANQEWTDFLLGEDRGMQK